MTLFPYTTLFRSGTRQEMKQTRKRGRKWKEEWRKEKYAATQRFIDTTLSPVGGNKHSFLRGVRNVVKDRLKEISYDV
jgi:hypothetical protein